MKKISLFLLWIAPLFLKAQDEQIIKFFPQINQSQWLNASNETDAKISIGLPVLSSTSFGFYSDGFTYHDLFKNVGDTTYLQLGNVINNLKSRNFIGMNTNVSVFSFNFSCKKFSLGFSANLRANAQFAYPGDLFKLLWNGNGNYVNQTLDIGNFGLNAMTYKEFALHFSTHYKKWTFGVSPKLLYGIADIYTANSSVTLFTDPNYYQLTSSANLDVRTSGFQDSTQRANNNSDYPKDIFTTTANKGFAIDLGAKFKYNDKLSFAAGINDLGSIKWTYNVQNYTTSISNVSFDGIHAENFFQGDSSSGISSQKYTDSLSKVFDLKKNKNAYTTKLPINIYAMANYELGKHQKIGATVNFYSYEHNLISSATLCYQLKFGKHLSVAASYTAKSRSPFNLGGGLVLQFLNMQWYFMTDNWYAAVKPLDSKNVNFHFGMNIVAGNAKGKLKQPKEIAPKMEELKTPTADEKK